MTTKNDGGPAFPSQVPDPNGPMTNEGVLGWAGLSLRDYFAAAALGRLGRAEMAEMCDDIERIALGCYRMADAMLAAREEGE